MKQLSKIYIGGALTRTQGSIRETYEKLIDVCKPYCPMVYVPHLMGTDPIKDPDVTPRAVWEKDVHEVTTADLVIAYVGEPSLGVGAELEIARVAKTDIILWKFKGEKVSRMALGNPAVIEMVEAVDDQDLFEKVRTSLEKFEENKIS